MKDTLLYTFKSHYIAILLALGIAVAAIAPYAYFALTTPSYTGISMMGADAEDHYVARVKDVYEGHGLGNAYLPNDKAQPYSIPGLGETLTAFIGKSTGLSAPQINILSKFIFPFLVALVLYILLYILFNSKRIALLSTSMVMLADGLTKGMGAWRLLLHASSASDGFMSYSRPINPEISSLFLFGALLVFYRTFYIKEQPSLAEALFTGVLAGAALYVSPFVATFLCTLIAVSFFWFLYQRRFSATWYVVAIGAATLVTVIPFILNYAHLTTLPDYTGYSLREGLAHTRQFIVSSWLIILALLTLFAWPKRFSKARPFFATSIAALWLLTEQQMITGASLQPSHYHWYLTIPLVNIMLGMYVGIAIEFFIKQGWLRTAATAGILCVLFFNAVLIQTHSYQKNYPQALEAQQYAPLFAYLNANPPQSIWADTQLSQYIPIYTKSDTPNNLQVGNYVLPPHFLTERLFLSYRLRGIAAKDATTTMQKERTDVSSAIYALYWRQQTGSFDGMPDSILYALANEYASVYATMPLKTLFHNVEVTEIAWDRTKEPGWPIDTLPFVIKVYTSGTIELYKINT